MPSRGFSQAKSWIDLGVWGKGMDGFKLPASDELSGQELTLRFQGSKRATTCTFQDARSLAWETEEGFKPGSPTLETYEAIRIAPEIFFVDFLLGGESPVSISMALDLGTRKATVITARAADKEQTRRSFADRLERGVDFSTIEVKIQNALINPLSPHEPIPFHKRTADLVGKRIQYTYSRDQVYEHIYLNERFFTWHCLEGVEKGLADTDICDYFKIAPDIYLFSWREKVMPTFGLVLINLKEMRSNGKTFGLDVSSGKCMNFTMGALAEFVSPTTSLKQITELANPKQG